MLKKIAVALVVLLPVAAAIALFAMTPPGESTVRFWLGLASYGGQAREGLLQVGDRAPDVPLIGLDRPGAPGPDPRRLGERIGPRPLVLVFGSFT